MAAIGTTTAGSTHSISAGITGRQLEPVLTSNSAAVTFQENRTLIANDSFINRSFTWFAKSFKTPEGILLIAKATKESFVLLGLIIQNTRFAGWKSLVDVVVRTAGYTVKGLTIPLLFPALPALVGICFEWKDLNWTDIASTSSTGVSLAIQAWDAIRKGSLLMAAIPPISLAGDVANLISESKKSYQLNTIAPEQAEIQNNGVAERSVALSQAKTLQALKVAKIAIGTLASFVLIWQIAIPLISASWAAAITVKQYEFLYAVFACATSSLAVTIDYYRSTMQELPIVQELKKN